MKINREPAVPYPYPQLFGKLRLVGLELCEVQRIAELVAGKISGTTLYQNEQVITNAIQEVTGNENFQVLENFETICKYEKARLYSENIPPLVLVLEGASATGKSLLSLNLIQEIGATRIISTDTIRQVLRGLYRQDDVPELFCHTYQAYQFKQAGPPNLDPVIRGFLAQCKVVFSEVATSVERIIQEGAVGLVEGVHILPGELMGLSEGVFEILIEPPEKIHRAMFLNKSRASGLTTIVKNDKTRVIEFAAAKKIQQYLHDLAKQKDVQIIHLENYETALSEIRGLVVEKIRKLIELPK